MLGQEYPDIFTSINNLTGMLKSQRKYKKAEQIYREVLGLKERVLSREHPDIFTSINNLAGIFKS